MTVENQTGGGVTPEVLTILRWLGRGALAESWASEDGLTGYRKYADGRIEQYGVAATKGNALCQVLLPLAMKNMNYTVQISTLYRPGAVRASTYTDKQTTGFSIAVSNASANLNTEASEANWLAIGAWK